MTVDEYLPRSAAALKRHRRRLAPQIEQVRAGSSLDEVQDLEIVLYALGDDETKEAIRHYWQTRSVHPVAQMEAEDVKALDRAIAQAIVVAATCDPTVNVRQKRSGQSGDG